MRGILNILEILTRNHGQITHCHHKKVGHMECQLTPAKKKVFNKLQIHYLHDLAPPFIYDQPFDPTIGSLYRH